VRIVSCNPAELKDPLVPPTFSGYPASDMSGWAAYWDEYAHVHSEMHASFDAFCRDRGAPPLPPLEFAHTSTYLNLTLYPAEADYRRAVPLNDNWHNLEASVRTTEQPYAVPAGDGRLVYLSLGSLGSADVLLMQRLIDTLAETDHRVIVSLGPQHDQLTLHDGMVGEEFLPQTTILPQVDAVVTHGGNNTITECLWFGKPMVVLPLFWDQYDNAQRMDETGFGVRLDTYHHTPDELTGALNRVLNDGALHARLAAVSGRLRKTPGTERAADLIERLE
jgi:MGT family glycosyltransferase